MTFLILRMAINPNYVSRKEAGKKGRTVVKALKETSGGTLRTKAEQHSCTYFEMCATVFLLPRILISCIVKRLERTKHRGKFFPKPFEVVLILTWILEHALFLGFEFCLSFLTACLLISLEATNLCLGVNQFTVSLGNVALRSTPAVSVSAQPVREFEWLSNCKTTAQTFSNLFV